MHFKNCFAVVKCVRTKIFYMVKDGCFIFLLRFVGQLD